MTDPRLKPARPSTNFIFGKPTYYTTKRGEKYKVCWCCNVAQTYLYFLESSLTDDIQGVCHKCWSFKCVSIFKNCLGKKYH